MAHRVGTGFFADIEFFGVNGSPFQKLGIAEVVIDHDICAFQAVAALERE